MDKLGDKINRTALQKLSEGDINSIFNLLITPSRDLQNITDLPEEIIDQCKLHACELTIKDKFIMASQVPPWERINTGCKNIDNILKGGIPVNGITEIIGGSGCGKTQICLQLALQIQLPAKFGGKEKEVVYICTEDPFPTKRLSQLVKSFNSKYSTDLDYENHIFIEHSADFEQTRRCLLVQLPNFIRSRNIGLLVIDSIAGIFRSENENVNYSNRSKDISVLSSALYELTEKHNIAVVCVNQVTEDLSNGILEPCLGLSWSNYVTCRFKITRYKETPIRKFEVVFAPDLPLSYCDFIISEDGVNSYN